MYFGLIGMNATASQDVSVCAVASILSISADVK